MRYAAFLRGMNLGRRRITNDELCARFEAMGFEEVAAFLASGNVVFAAEGSRAELEAGIEAGLEESLSWKVPSFVRTGEEVRAIAARPVFEDRLEETAGKIQVALLKEKPSAAARRVVRELGSDEDFLELDGRELYWLPRGNFSDSELDLKTIEKKLGPMTIRTRRTFQRIASKFF